MRAMNYGLRRLAGLPLSLRLVREVHGELMRGVRGEESTPGEFRRSPNWIGPSGSTLRDARFVPPPPHGLLRVLGEWETFRHARSEQRLADDRAGRVNLPAADVDGGRLHRHAFEIARD